jgi:hypothetical protein
MKWTLNLGTLTEVLWTSQSRTDHNCPQAALLVKDNRPWKGCICFTWKKWIRKTVIKQSVTRSSPSWKVTRAGPTGLHGSTRDGLCPNIGGISSQRISKTMPTSRWPQDEQNFVLLIGWFPSIRLTKTKNHCQHCLNLYHTCNSTYWIYTFLNLNITFNNSLLRVYIFFIFRCSFHSSIS